MRLLKAALRVAGASAYSRGSAHAHAPARAAGHSRRHRWPRRKHREITFDRSVAGSRTVPSPRIRLCAGRCATPVRGAAVRRHVQLASAVIADTGVSALTTSHSLVALSHATRLRINSPQNGDRYGVPPGIDARDATIAHRLPLVAGTHVIRTSASADRSDDVRVTIER